MSFYHKHLLINATVKNPIIDAKLCEKWFRDLVDLIDMKVLVEPKAVYCNTDGNEGVTGTVVIETIFAIPGVGSEIVYAIYSSQIFMLQSIVAAISVFYVGVNFIADLLGTKIDPRTRDRRA